MYSCILLNLTFPGLATLEGRNDGLPTTFQNPKDLEVLLNNERILYNITFNYGLMHTRILFNLFIYTLINYVYQ